MKVSLLIPVYGSAGILREAHRHFSQAIAPLATDYELVFCYDGSPDESLSVLQELAAADAHVRVLANERNMGLGYTLRQLFRAAQGDVVIYFDADAYRCFDLTVLPNFLEMIRQYDVLVAARYEESQDHIPFYRVYASRLYHLLGRWLFGVQVTDVGSGFVMFRRRVIEQLDLRANGFDIHIELFARAKRAGYRIKEVNVPYMHWFGGSFSVFRHAWATFKGTLRMWWHLRKDPPS